MKSNVNDLYTISVTSDANAALQKIEDNKSGIVFVADADGKVVGSVTDGDIRRHLIKGDELASPITQFMNDDFVYAYQDTPRDQVLKTFDTKIKSVPILSEDGKLLRVVFHDNFPLNAAHKVSYHAKSPVRIGLAGGGSDLTYYFSKKRGIAINLAITLFARAKLVVRQDSAIHIVAHSLAVDTGFETKEAFIANAGDLQLVAEVVRLVNPDYGFDLEIYSDVPIGSGLGGSSSVTMAVLGCFNQVQSGRWTKAEMVDLAYQAERHYLGVDGGWQDQYAAAFGGYNYIEFSQQKNRIFPLRLEQFVHQGLEEMLMLVDTGIQHLSGELHAEQRKSVADDKEAKEALIAKNISCGEQFFDFVMHGKFAQAAEILDQMWHNKRQLSASISSDKIDEIYAMAKQSGALGGKLLGAGAGGHFCFVVPLADRTKFMQNIRNYGLTPLPVTIDNDGLVCWTTNEY